MNQLDHKLKSNGSQEWNYARVVSYYQGMLQICVADLSGVNISESIRALQQLKCYSYEPEHEAYMELIAEHEHLLISLAADEIVQPQYSLNLLLSSVDHFHLFAFEDDGETGDVQESLEDLRCVRFCHALWHCVGFLNQAFLDVHEGLRPYYQQIHRQLCNAISFARQLHYQVGLLGLIDVERKIRECKYQRQAVHRDVMAALYDIFIALLSPFKDQLIIPTEVDIESSTILNALGQLHYSLKEKH